MIKKYEDSDINEFYKLKYEQEKYNIADSNLNNDNSLWNYGVIVIDKYGNIETEAVVSYTGFEDHHGAANKRALSRLGITKVDGIMGVEVALNSSKLDIVTLHTYAPSLFVYSPLKITQLQFEAIYALLFLRYDFDYILINNEKDLVFDRMEKFLEYLKTLVDLDITNEKSR